MGSRQHLRYCHSLARSGLDKVYLETVVQLREYKPFWISWELGSLFVFTQTVGYAIKCTGLQDVAHPRWSVETSYGLCETNKIYVLNDGSMRDLCYIKDFS